MPKIPTKPDRPHTAPRGTRRLQDHMGRDLNLHGILGTNIQISIRNDQTNTATAQGNLDDMEQEEDHYDVNRINRNKTIISGCQIQCSKI